MEVSKNELAKFTALLNREPEKSELKKHPFSGIPYIPISYLEAKLDVLFYGLWECIPFKSERQANEMCVTITFRYFHPIHRLWISRAGYGASAIQQNKGADITDMTQKKKNALEKDFASAKAMAFRNAVKSVGVYFGRNLGRGMKDETLVAVPNANTEIQAIAAAKKGIREAINEDDLKALYSNSALTVALIDKEVVRLMKDRVSEFRTPKQIT